jgi:4-hydroxy-4-methyl-2-oxoglutarate aldolase
VKERTMHGPVLSNEEFSALRQFDTCTVSNAIETFGVRLRNTGFADSSVRCMFDDLPSLVGYAATARLRSEDPPVERTRVHDRSDWWQSILQVPEPRIVVLEDMDTPPGRGAFIGDVHSAILRALGCIGVVTNGAVRELPRVRELGFQLFAGNVAVSHAYAHIFHFDAAVKVGGLEVRPGDLLHGDTHGVLSIPRQIAAQVPAVATRLRDKENQLIAICREGGLPLDKLREVIRILE